MPEALYFGCRGEPGHYLQKPNGKTIYWPERDLPGFPWSMGLMDSGLLKNGKHPDIQDGKVFWTCGGRDEFWFAFFWWDNSVDRRGGSNSGFYVCGFPFEGRETLIVQRDKAFEFACQAWPKVIKRQAHPLVLQA